MRGYRALSAVLLASCTAFSVFHGPALAAGGDAAAGKRVFGQCASCHSTAAGRNGIGPSLAGIAGRKSGTAERYSYSPALKKAGIVWDDEALDRYLKNPAGFVRGTKMYVGVQDADDRRNVIAYLKELSP